MIQVSFPRSTVQKSQSLLPLVLWVLDYSPSAGSAFYFIWDLSDCLSVCLSVSASPRSLLNLVFTLSLQSHGVQYGIFVRTLLFVLFLGQVLL